MANEAMASIDVSKAAEIVEKLDRAKVKVSVALWVFLSEYEDWRFEPTYVGPCFIEPFDAVGRCGRAALFGQWEVLRLHTELGQHIFHRNPFAASAEEVLGLLEAATVLVADWFRYIGYEFQRGVDRTSLAGGS